MTRSVIPEEMKQCVISIVTYFFISDLEMDEKYFVYKFLAVLSPTFIFCGFFYDSLFLPLLIFTYLQYLGV